MSSSVQAVSLRSSEAFLRGTPDARRAARAALLFTLIAYDKICYQNQGVVLALVRHMFWGQP